MPTTITLTVETIGGTDRHLHFPTEWVHDPELTADTLGLLIILAASAPGPRDLTLLAHTRGYDPGCLRTIADDLCRAGYATITDGGGA